MKPADIVQEVHELIEAAYGSLPIPTYRYENGVISLASKDGAAFLLVGVEENLVVMTQKFPEESDRNKHYAPDTQHAFKEAEAFIQRYQ